MNYLLHIDTSADDSLVAVSNAGQLLSSMSCTTSRNHAATLNLLIQDTLGSINISLYDISGIVTCAGPGSYTGLRIGMATAKGICYALDLPLYLHNKLELLAYQAMEIQKSNGQLYEQYVSLLLAREKEYFIGVYDKDSKCSLPPVHISGAELLNHIDTGKKTLVVTNCGISILNPLDFIGLEIENEIKLNPVYWAKYAIGQQICNKNVKISEAEPFYLKQVYTHN